MIVLKDFIIAFTLFVLASSFRLQKLIFRRLLQDTRVLQATNRSPQQNGIKKEIIRAGQRNEYPKKGDTVEILWKLYRSDGSLAHEEIDFDDPFDFVVEASPPDVIPGWDIAVQGMLTGEEARFVIPSNLAFGAEGLPPPISIGPNEDITCTIHLLNVIAPFSQRYKHVSYNESIKEELVETIQSDERPYMETEQREKTARFYDPAKHKLDPNRRVAGESADGTYTWDENPRTIDIQLQIPDWTRKSDLQIDITTTHVKIAVLGDSPQILLEGKLYGRVLPSESSWMIAPASNRPLSFDVISAEPNKRIESTNSHLIVSLQKGYGYDDIWAAVLDLTSAGASNRVQDTDDDESMHFQ